MHERQTNDIKNIRNMRYFEKIKNKGKPMPSSDNSELMKKVARLLEDCNRDRHYQKNCQLI